MKEEYDFTNAEQGRFYRPIEELDIPVYLDKDIREVLMNHDFVRLTTHSQNLCYILTPIQQR